MKAKLDLAVFGRVLQESIECSSLEESERLKPL